MISFLKETELLALLEARGCDLSLVEVTEITSIINLLVAKRVDDSYRNALAQLDLMRANYASY